MFWVFKNEVAQLKKETINIRKETEWDVRRGRAKEEGIDDIPGKFGLKFPLDSLEDVRAFARILKLPATAHPSAGDLLAPKDELVSGFQ